MIGDDEFWQELFAIGAGFADCGQYTAGGADYMVGSIHPMTHHEQPLGDRARFPFENGLSAFSFCNWPVPANAQGVCFFDYGPQNPGRFHYGRLELPNLTISMTDATLANDLATTELSRVEEHAKGGGVFTTLAPFDFRDRDSGEITETLLEVAQGGVQPIRHLPNVHAFVDYCENRFTTQYSRYFFVYCRVMNRT